jgi:transcriptional regulator with XRE-family HTH domain
VPRFQRDPDPRSLIGHFGAELRYLRTEATLSMGQLAALLGCTPQWISQIELGDSTPSEEFANDLDTFFKTGGSFHRLWANIKKAVRSSVLLPGFPGYLELEAKATYIRRFSTLAIPGLLQTEGYARAVMNAGWPHPAMDERVETRMDRQGILLREKPPKALFVLDESVLLRPFGGVAVMHDQLGQLVGYAESEDVQVRVLPFQASAAAGLDGSFTMLSFEKDSDVVYVEAPGISQLVEDQGVVADCAVRFNLLMGEALPRAEYTKFMMKVREGYA